MVPDRIYDFFDIRVKTGNGQRVVSMVLPWLTNVTKSAVIFADPEKLGRIVNAYNLNRSENYLCQKAVGSLASIYAATTKNKAETSLPAPSYAKCSITLPSMNFWRTKAGEIRAEFNDGTTRTANLIRLGVTVIPIVIEAKTADLALKTVGSNITPIPAEAFVVPLALRQQCWDKEAPHLRERFNSAKRRRAAAERLAHKMAGQNFFRDFHL